MYVPPSLTPPARLAEDTDMDTSVASTVVSPALRPHLAYLDGIRGLAALFVLWHHTYLQIWTTQAITNQKPHLPAPVWLDALRYGHWAVDVFIVLSGFCLMLPFVQGRPLPQTPAGLWGWTRSFLARRARRVLMPYYLAMLLSMGLISWCIGQDTGTHWDGSTSVTLEGLLAHLFLMQDVFVAQVGGQINHAFWSIAVEWHIYFMFPFLVWGWRRAGAIPTTACVACGALLLAAATGGTFLRGMTFSYYGLFALGALAAKIAFSPNRRLRVWRKAFPWAKVAGAISGAVLLLCAWRGYFVVEGEFFVLDFLIGGAAAMALIAIATPQEGLTGRLRRFLDTPFVAKRGVWAYSLYLVHAPLLQVLWQYGVHPLRLSPLAEFSLMIGAGTPLISLAAYGFYLVCERPFTRPAPARRSPSAPHPVPAQG